MWANLYRNNSIDRHLRMLQFNIAPTCWKATSLPVLRRCLVLPLLATSPPLHVAMQHRCQCCANDCSCRGSQHRLRCNAANTTSSPLHADVPTAEPQRGRRPSLLMLRRQSLLLWLAAPPPLHAVNATSTLLHADVPEAAWQGGRRLGLQLRSPTCSRWWLWPCS